MNTNPTVHSHSLATPQQAFHPTRTANETYARIRRALERWENEGGYVPMIDAPPSRIRATDK
jgi:hypothetical protein